MCRFSIVVPVYQAEKYLEECICSILKQEKESWELILVDDGASDGSPEICDRYAGKYPQIKVLHQQNTGPLLARCRGFEKAKGTYLLSLDADDRLSEQALKRLDETLDQEDADILIFGYQRLDEDCKKKKQGYRLKNELYEGGQKTELFLELWEKNSFNLVWNKVFRTDFVRQRLRVPEELKKVKTGADAGIGTPLLLQANKIRTISEILYEYRTVPESISSSFNRQKGQDVLLYRTYMFKQLQQAGMMNEKIEKRFYEVTCKTMSYILSQCARSSMGKEKLDFIRGLMESRLYQESLPYSKTAGFSRRKRASFWLLRHRLFRPFIWYECVQASAKKICLKYIKK